MCGILGEVSFQADLINKNDFIYLNSLSSDRGPDYSGYYTDSKYFQFGFNRLSILDISDAGNQPIHSRDNRYSMIFNGEIYNYLEIKKDLQQIGYRFNSSGDSEVLVNAFEAYGIDNTLKMIDGMFAIGLFDNLKKSIHLIRDFAGVKPLYYACDKNKVVFSSQYNQIAKHQDFIRNEINIEVLKLYLLIHYIPAPFGILDKTYSILPGEIVTIDYNGEISHRRYWELAVNNNPRISDKKEAIEYIDNSLNESVKSQLISDVPLGVFLSGGIDSPLISYYSQKHKEVPLDAFSIGSNSEFDESILAKHYGKEIGLNHQVTMMSANDSKIELDNAILSLSEPFADISILPTYMISKIASSKVKVCLSGDGGDELFFGYERFWSIEKNINIQKLPYFMKYFIYGIDRVFNNNNYYNSCLLYNSQGDAHFNLNSRFGNNFLNNVAPYLSEINLPNDFKVYSYPLTTDRDELIKHMRYAEFYGMMQKTLKKVDGASMANSLEVRVPFLSKKFIESSLKLDPSLSYSGIGGKKSNKKDILKKLLKHKIKNSRIQGIKHGFLVPIADWIRTELKDRFHEVLLDKSINQYFGFDENATLSLLDSHNKKLVDAKWPLFTLYSLFIWKNTINE